MQFAHSTLHSSVFVLCHSLHHSPVHIFIYTFSPSPTDHPHQPPLLFFIFRRLLPRVATADIPSSFVLIIYIFLRHFNHCHILSPRIHKPPFRPSQFPLSWQLHPQHPSANIILLIIFPPCMSKPPQPLMCSLQTVLPALSSDVLIPDLAHSCHS